jgi:photosystem II PsbT protein
LDLGANGFPHCFSRFDDISKLDPFNHEDRFVMESVAYILVLTLALGVLFFAIAFREPPRIGK